jgi:hypothetical protein
LKEKKTKKREKERKKERKRTTRTTRRRMKWIEDTQLALNDSHDTNNDHHEHSYCAHCGCTPAYPPTCLPAYLPTCGRKGEAESDFWNRQWTVERGQWTCSFTVSHVNIIHSSHLICASSISPRSLLALAFNQLSARLHLISSLASCSSHADWSGAVLPLILAHW